MILKLLLWSKWERALWYKSSWPKRLFLFLIPDTAVIVAFVWWLAADVM